MALSKRYQKKDEKYTLAEKFVTSVLSFAGSFFTLDRLVTMYQKNLTRYARQKTNYYIYESIIKYLLIYPKYYYKHTVYLDFHNKKFPAPAEYDAVLRASYGDYMTPVKTGYVVHADKNEETD